MKAEIVSVGTELLLGQIANTNAQFLAQQLSGMGINHYTQTTVGDNPERLKKVLAQREGQSDIYILTGGLGPTRDDLTKETVADYLDEKLEIDPASLASIEADFERSGRTMPDNCRKMAAYFSRGFLFRNSQGQALGTAVEKDGRFYLLLPGPPRELKTMFLEEVKEFLLDLYSEDVHIDSRYLNYFGIGESYLADLLDDYIVNQSNPTLALYPGGGTVTLRLTAYGESKHSNEELLNDLTHKILERSDRWFYGEGYDYTPAQAFVNYLLNSKETISFAESFTGGKVANMVVDNPGSSEIFLGSIVAYDRDRKSKLLGVSDHTLDVEGMVSEACAREMAQGAIRRMDSDLAISFTGVAGPAEMEGHPPGTVFIGLASKDGSMDEVLALELDGDRDYIRKASISHAFVHFLKKKRKPD